MKVRVMTLKATLFTMLKMRIEKSLTMIKVRDEVKRVNLKMKFGSTVVSDRGQQELSGMVLGQMRRESKYKLILIGSTL